MNDCFDGCMDFVLRLTSGISFGAAVAEQQKRPSLAYDSKIYERHEVRTNKVSFSSCMC
jgi:hypothetical protein